MLKRFATNAAALAIGGVVAQLAFVSIEIVVARELGAADYGIFATVQAFALANLIIIDLGMTWWAIESGSKDHDNIAELLGTTTVLKFLGFMVVCPLAAWVLHLLGYDERTVGFFLIFFFYSLTMAVQDSLSAVYTARQRMVVNGLFQGGAALVIAAVVMATLILDQGLYGVAVGFVIGSLLVTVAWAALTWRAERPRIRMAASGEILRGSYLYGLTGLLVHIFRKGDVLLLSALTTMPQVGIYAAGSKLLDLAYKVPMVGALVVSPTLFKQNQADDTKYRYSADLLVRVNTAAGLLLALVCYHSAPWLIGLLFGEGYDAAAVVLRVLSASFALKFLYFGLQTVLTTRGQHGVRTRALGVSTALAMGGHAILIPLFGAVGAATSVVCAETVLVALYMHGIDDATLRRTVALRFLAATIAIGAGAAVPAAVGLTGPIASLVGLLVSGIVLSTTGFVRMSELESAARRITSEIHRPAKK